MTIARQAWHYHWAFAHLGEIMPERVIRWLHLSDFHCGKEAQSAPLEACLEELHKHILEQCEQDRGPDLVFITGDIANKGVEEEYKYFTEKFLTPLQKLLGDSAEEKIIIVPGNHDACRDESAMAFAKGRHVYKEFPQSMHPDEKGLKRRREILPRFSDFMESDISPIMGNWLESIDGYWSKVIKIGDSTVGVLAVNTAWFSKDDKDKGVLTPGVLITRKGLEIIKDTSIKVVLGHHPLSWFDDSQAEQIANCFASNSAIYLHGHLHHSFSRNMDGGVGDFRVFASGAVFEPPETEYEDGPLESRLNWIEVDLTYGKIYVEPFKLSGTTWKKDFDAFDEIFRVKGQDRWWFDLPGYKPAEAPAEVLVAAPEQSPKPEPPSGGEIFQPPPGWSGVTAASLRRQMKPVSKEDALAFFDGWEPNWSLVLSSAAPRRQVVFQVRDVVTEVAQTPQRSVTLLYGPSGEGKSTVLLQSVAALLNTNQTFYILWQNQRGAGLSTKFIEELPYTDGAWLFVADEADLIAEQISKIVTRLHQIDRHDVHFLLATRDTAWLSAQAERLGWYASCKFRQMDIRGLGQADAALLVRAWQQYGSEGLKALAGRDLDEAASALVDAAREGAKLPEGALFGALLDVRYGPEGLKSRLSNLLGSFAGKQALPEVSLLQAYAYIAAPHAVGINVLTKDILARAWKCRPGDVLPVLQRFGKEAFLAVPGRFITTRHQKIAKAACRLLGTQFGVDMDEVYVDLLRAAVEVLKHGGDVVMTPWHGLRDHFSDQGHKDFALRLARLQYESDPTSRNLVKLSQLLRESKNAPEAARLFRDSGLRPHDLRGFYFEWASAEGEAGHYAINAWLAAYSLADAGYASPPTLADAKKSLAGLGMAFLKLHEATQDHDYALATGAVGQLGPRVADDPTTLGYFQRYSREATTAGVESLQLAQAWGAIERAIRKAWETCKDALPGIPPADGFKYKQLLNLLNLPQDAPA